MAVSVSLSRFAGDLRMANRANRPDSWQGVVDANLCHGAAGNAHLFARLYQGTGIHRFKEKALPFYSGALAMGGDSTQVAGFLAKAPIMAMESARNPFVDLPGLLEGGVGIDLCLLAATTDVEPSWDRHLLAHVPPGSAWGPVG